MKITMFRTMRLDKFAAAYRACRREYCTAEKTAEKNVHPYRRIHPWKSETEFADSLLKNIIYNKDGIIAINKPYGISTFNPKSDEKVFPFKTHKIVGMANYTVQNVLPYLAKELDVPNLIPCTGSEKYMSGVYIFGTSKKVQEQVNLARVRSNQMKLYKKYWIVTIRVPNILKGQYHIAMNLQISPEGIKKPIILTKWSNNAEKRQDVKILNVDYKLISNSTENLSSLIELGVSTRKWHSMRLFTSTMLYAPILGDNYHGSRVQQVMGTWIKVNPFAVSCDNMPVIDRQLLELLNIKQSQQEIIPCHVHLKNILLKSFMKKQNDILIEAPLMHPFDWTCKQLMFKNIPKCEVDNVGLTEEDKVETICV